MQESIYDLTIDELLLKCIKEVSNVPKGTEFTVPDLFKGYEWKLFNINKGQLGKMFNYEVNNGSLLNVVKDTTEKSKETADYLENKKEYEREIYIKL